MQAQLAILVKPLIQLSDSIVLFNRRQTNIGVIRILQFGFLNNHPMRASEIMISRGPWNFGDK